MNTQDKDALFTLLRSLQSLPQHYEGLHTTQSAVISKLNIPNIGQAVNPPFEIHKAYRFKTLSEATQHHFLTLIRDTFDILTPCQGKQFLFKVDHPTVDFVIHVFPTFFHDVVLFNRHPLTGDGIELSIDAFTLGEPTQRND